MKIKALVNCITSWTKGHSPELLLAGGIVSFGAALYFAGKGAIKSEETTEELYEAKQDVETKKETIQLYSKAGLEYAKNFAPCAGFTALSLTCFCASYGILKKRYVTVFGAYCALDASYQAYRQRVIEDRGAEWDKYYLTGMKPKKITVTNEDGTKEKKTAFEVPLSDAGTSNPYVFKFSKYKANGDRNMQWQNSAALNMSIVLGHQDYLNDQLYSRCTMNKDNEVIQRGSVFLNEVRTLLGEDPTPAGSVTGWLFSNGEPGCNGYIDFRVMEGYEIDHNDPSKEIPYILIDPNVDGIIYDLVGKFEEHPFIARFYDDAPVIEE